MSEDLPPENDSKTPGNIGGNDTTVPTINHLPPTEDAPGAFPEKLEESPKKRGRHRKEDTDPGEVQDIDEILSKFNLNEAFTQGYKPYRRDAKKEGFFVSIRTKSFPYKETRVGHYTEELWTRVNEEYQKFVEENITVEEEEKRKLVQSKISGIMRTRLTPPPPVPSNIGLDSTTILYYEWIKGKGFNGSLGDFLNEVTRSYFKIQGIELAVVVK